MKFLLVFLLTAAATYGCGLYLPWWAFVPAAFVITFLVRPLPGTGFLGAFLGVFGVWAGLALAQNSSNQGLLAAKMGLLLGGIPGGGLMLLSSVFGGVLGGLAGWSGALLMAKPPRQQQRRRRRRR